MASRIVNTLMKMCFYLEDQYIPYSKWFGTGFGQLEIAKQLGPLFHQILFAQDATQLEAGLCKVYPILLQLQNEKGICKVLDCVIESYYGRPYQVIDANQIKDALLNSIKETDIKHLNVEWIGLDQKIDGMDFTDNQALLARVIR